MAKYRKKPIVIEAWQFTKDSYAVGVPREFRHKSISYWSQHGGCEIGGEIETLEGVMDISEGDYIIKGVKGEFYPIKNDIFEMTYEPALEHES